MYWKSREGRYFAGFLYWNAFTTTLSVIGKSIRMVHKEKFSNF